MVEKLTFFVLVGLLNIARNTQVQHSLARLARCSYFSVDLRVISFKRNPRHKTILLHRNEENIAYSENETESKSDVLHLATNCCIVVTGMQCWYMERLVVLLTGSLLTCSALLVVVHCCLSSAYCSYAL